MKLLNFFLKKLVVLIIPAINFSGGSTTPAIKESCLYK
jgi:hypothetical protein